MTEPEIEMIPVDRSLLEAAIVEIRKWKVARGGGDQVVLNLEAGLRLHDASHLQQSNLKVTGFRGNPLRVVLSNDQEASIAQKLVDTFATPSPFGQAEVRIPTAVHIGWRWKHHTGDTWQFVAGTDHPQLGFTPTYEAGVIYEKVFTVEEQPPIGWWYEDKTGCIHMSLDIGLGLQHEAQFGYKLHWMSSTEPSRYFENFGDIERFLKIRRLCGYVENGSEQPVKIFQDDATREWIIKAGKRSWSGRTLSQALDAAEVPEDD